MSSAFLDQHVNSDQTKLELLRTNIISDDLPDFGTHSVLIRVKLRIISRLELHLCFKEKCALFRLLYQGLWHRCHNYIVVVFRTHTVLFVKLLMVEDPFLENDMGILEALESEGLPKASLRLDHVEGVRVFVPRGS